ncbi:MAG: hypothetical protein QOE37_471 [Microbacteriaceae bacterium]|nr:hypothetical protein [Microbacteriaceae bacterium]
MHSSLLVRAGITAAAGAALVLAVPLSASAHVRVDPERATAGAESSLLTFTVPTESATAVTSRVVIDLPTATPFGFVSYQPVPGWSARVVTGKLPKPARIGGTTVTEAPTQVIWNADPGTRLAGGEFQQFVLTVGPIPDTGALRFPTTQTYSDGTTVRWAQATPASGQEPEHPVPVLFVKDAPPAADHAPDAVSVTARPAAPTPGETLAVALGGVALLVSLLAAALAVAAFVRGRSARRP